MTKTVPFDEACRFVIRLGIAAHGYGSTASRLERFLTRLTTALGYRGVFRSTPTEIVFGFQEGKDAPQRVELVGLPGTGLDLNRLAKVGELVDAVESGRVSVPEAITRLDEIDKIAPPWGRMAMGLSYAFVGAGLAVLFSLAWADVLVATLLTLVLYGMVVASGRFGARTAEWLPLSTSFVVAVLAAITKMWVPDLNLVMVIVAAIAILLPGYGVSLGMIELVSGHVVSGTANLMSGLVYLIKQIAGAWLGIGLVAAVVTIPVAGPGTPVSASWLWLFMPPLIVSLCVAFQTAPRDLFWASASCGIAYGGVLLGSVMVGGNLGNLLGTIVAVVFANLWAARTRRPTSIVLIPAIVLLVSGSIGFRGLAAMAAGQTGLGEQQFLQMFVVALTIAAGLLIGCSISRPKITL